MRTATFVNGATMATVSIPLIVDNIVEMNEEFVIAINQPKVRGLTLGTLSMTTGIIRDSSSECICTSRAYSTLEIQLY